MEEGTRKRLSPHRFGTPFRSRLEKWNANPYAEHELGPVAEADAEPLRISDAPSSRVVPEAQADTPKRPLAPVADSLPPQPKRNYVTVAEKALAFKKPPTLDQAIGMMSEQGDVLPKSFYRPPVVGDEPSVSASEGEEPATGVPASAKVVAEWKAELPGALAEAFGDEPEAEEEKEQETEEQAKAREAEELRRLTEDFAKSVRGQVKSGFKPARNDEDSNA